ncbi:hypothetical protein BDN72DRAFT_906724 [Pluteus cervinus]|uniref:Uncharacterized protein n=1 Tax=Pluteus cervinus TaxID=181527 RepID=A0ACD3A0N1_9AGAR|nr:hypothetical protein BDN72DRAFT_906724 [Pluteus cervinus]
MTAATAVQSRIEGVPTSLHSPIPPLVLVGKWALYLDEDYLGTGERDDDEKGSSKCLEFLSTFSPLSPPTPSHDEPVFKPWVQNDFSQLNHTVPVRTVEPYELTLDTIVAKPLNHKKTKSLAGFQLSAVTVAISSSEVWQYANTTACFAPTTT